MTASCYSVLNNAAALPPLPLGRTLLWRQFLL